MARPRFLREAACLGTPCAATFHDFWTSTQIRDCRAETLDRIGKFYDIERRHKRSSLADVPPRSASKS